jgi:hypothetical protein
MKSSDESSQYFNRLMANRHPYARESRVRFLHSGTRTSNDLVRYQVGRDAMATASFGRPIKLDAPVRRAVPKSPVSVSQQSVSDMVEWEFSEAMRSPRLPPGWFLLPSAAISALVLIAFLH